MIRTNVPGALVAIEQLPMDFSMSSCAPVGLPLVRVTDGPSRLNLPLQDKVTGRFRAKKSNVGP